MHPLADIIAAQNVPLRVLETGTVRVGQTRVSLDSVIGTFEEGATPEDIVSSFTTLELADVYSVISFYLKNREAVRTYLLQEDAKAEEVSREVRARWGNSGLRERLLSRLRHRDGV